ncbi:response regulator [Sporosarcina sp. Marseille-Q4063]|uniref:response regulator n=1 Tax=Sporosarcina sp. Marseille-Q4063 TaxID=2810514 RepID=UPI001BB0CEFD|nr:response regulator [Sporosarcina sp. Marseille-Q4063]QUW21537.1 response regulator [Sporosarcina sp. Marseille-Q4063]
MRILIAEDELLERKAMKKFIQDNFRDMEVVGEAVNGRKAIELAKEMEPDVIFMDIKMPGINGLEAIEKIHSMRPKTKFILVSAYDTFEYAKQAMQFGIKDYILKPGKKEEIITALFRLKKEVLNEAKMEEEKRQSEQLLKESFIRKLMKQPLVEDAFELKKQLYPQMKSGYFFVVTSVNLLEEKMIVEIIGKHVLDSFIVFKENDVVTVGVFVNGSVIKADQLLIARKLQIELGDDVFIGIGHIADSLENFPLSYREAYAANFQLKNEKKSNYGFPQKDVNHHQDIVSKIVQEIEKGKRDNAIAIFKENEPQLTMVDKENLYIDIQTMLVKKNLSITTGSISTLQSNDDWAIYMNVCCNKVNEYYESKQSMTIAKEYIMTHYGESISLEDIAELVNLSPNYFSNLFKEEFGETYIEFLTKIRMEQAKELIGKNTYSLKEISFMVGYKDPNYFSRVFKRYFHTSPKHFQDSIFEK